jgi:pSer/pThr/pTyr-binding forkhead associated (FHA) protein
MDPNPKGLYFERQGAKVQFSKILHISKENSVVGRGNDCDIRISYNSRTVSRHHCMLTLENGRLYVENVSGTTCTYLNNDKVGKRVVK